MQAHLRKTALFTTRYLSPSLAQCPRAATIGAVRCYSQGMSGGGSVARRDERKETGLQKPCTHVQGLCCDFVCCKKVTWRKSINVFILCTKASNFVSLSSSSGWNDRNIFLSTEASKRSETIGFIGLGQMGYHMANNISRTAPPNATLLINDVNRPIVDQFVAQAVGNVRAVDTPAEVAERAGVVITMLPASPHVREVYMGKGGLLEGVSTGSFVIDSSTIDATLAKEVAAEVAFRGGKAVDAPVSGGILGAEAATLTFMVGSSTTEDFDFAKPILSRMGKNIVHCGLNGNGQVAKICNNMLLGVSMIAVAETMQLGVRMGMDPKLLAQILNTSSGRCWSSDTYNPCPGVIPSSPASKEYKGGFGNQLMAKDLRLAVNAANDSKSTILLGALAQQVYNLVSNTEGYEKLDFSSVFKWLGESDDKAAKKN